MKGEKERRRERGEGEETESVEEEYNWKIKQNAKNLL
jgi:hypothetical protein